MSPRATALICCLAAVFGLSACGGSDSSHSACVRARAALAQYKAANLRMGLRIGQAQYEQPLIAASTRLQHALAEVGRAKKGSVTEETEFISETLSRQEALLTAVRAHDTKTVNTLQKNLNQHLEEGLNQIEIICPSAK